MLIVFTSPLPSNWVLHIYFLFFLQENVKGISNANIHSIDRHTLDAEKTDGSCKSNCGSFAILWKYFFIPIFSNWYMKMWKMYVNIKQNAILIEILYKV